MSLPAAFCRCFVICALLGSGVAEAWQDSGPPTGTLAKLELEGLPNALRINRQLISGGLPEGEAAFARLKELGVRTVISVDGVTPDVAAAGKHGLRYVHLPHGYAGISPQRAAELAKAIRDLPGPIYLHCHHGKHRSPAAAATACRALGWISEQQAEEVLQLAGTSPHYLGLFAAVRETSPLDRSLLDRLAVEFQPTVPLPEVAEAMVAMELHFERLEQLAANDWKPRSRSPELKPGHEALLLREQFTELLRTETIQAESADYREQLRSGEQLAAQLEELLRGEPKDPAGKEASRGLGALKANCTACHRRFRDQPGAVRGGNRESR